MFIVIVVGVSLIYHFYHKQLYLLELGAVIKFNEKTKEIRLQNEQGVRLSPSLPLSPFHPPSLPLSPFLPLPTISAINSCIC